MKKIIPWICVVVLIATTHYFYKASNAKDAELTKAHEELQEVEKLRADNEELRKLPNQQAEIDRLTKDNKELIRLRGEVQQLRTLAKQKDVELNKAQASGAQAMRTQEQIVAQLKKDREDLIAAQEAARNQVQQGDPNAPLSEPARQAAACINQLRQIAGAKHMWALENKKGAEDVPTAADITPYLPKNATFNCPNGGTYQINAVGAPPTCSIPGHSLTPQQ